MRIEKGFTLIELLVASLLSVVVITSVGNIFLKSYSMSNKQVSESILYSELDSLLLLMTQEIKRAGYCGKCTSVSDFSLLGDDSVSSVVLIDDNGASASGQCIRFAYNHDISNGSGLSDDDKRGFRLHDGAFEIHRNYSENWECTGTHWIDSHDQLVQIEDLTFTRDVVTGSGSNPLTKQLITVSLTGSIGGKSLTRSAVVAVEN